MTGQPETGGIGFDGRVAVVTGAGAGLGRRYALELARRGAKVVVNDLGGARDGSGASTSAADGVAAEIAALGSEAAVNYDSVATLEGGEAIVRTAVERFGRVDIVINNAGILRDRSFVKMSPEEWRAVMAVHLDGAYFVTRPAFAKMKEQGYGRIVLTSSAAGLFGNFGQANYSAAKLGLVGFMNALKQEGARCDVKINTVAPIAGTRMTEDILPPDVFARSGPEFIAPLVLLLCSDRCPASGGIYQAGMGWYGRAAIVAGAGALVGDGGAPPSPEAVLEAFDRVASLDGAKGYDDLTSSMGPMLAALTPGG